VPEAEKGALREAVLALAAADDSPQVALQLALVAARIARFDHPREWCAPPQLQPQLLARAPRRGAPDARRTHTSAGRSCFPAWLRSWPARAARGRTCCCTTCSRS
jgi:hypothetical protein